MFYRQLFSFSYGYDCLKYFNLTVLDEGTLVFSTGNFINFFDVSTRQITFRRSALGGGIGHIRVSYCPTLYITYTKLNNPQKNGNPEYPYFAVAECGNVPIIVMYTWPEMDIVCVLKGGASKTYANMDFKLIFTSPPNYCPDCNWMFVVLMEISWYLRVVNLTFWSRYGIGNITLFF